uniref:Uncharacterized protein n=1 Tax=Lotharella oceanica TaxID=641309 RepID=A0A7S2U1S4_9EUKA|eukprot:CAMPEP_0170178036 /NCGR_PEP_ID=MMETSP0040_2-20121228/11625_1 /TAXON_ID=641309 /ORGANISM="Lotharella oceanica, Strain CCMP622" /LENGTH=260 /DNA_ID=CAMNT_0010420985 /DNA_START=22 /DNA_END=804 /DNA_ORIENTATION=+
MKSSTLALSCVLNVALFCVLCALMQGSGNISSTITRLPATQLVRPVAPRTASRSLAAYAHQTPNNAVTPKKVTLRLGAPATAAAVAGVCNLANVFPALAAEGKIFDFDLTLPYMATEIVLLSFFLEKLWFGPVGKLLDERNTALKENLQSASGNLEECDNIIAFAQQSLENLRTTLATERGERLDSLNKECEATIAVAKEVVNQEINSALSGIEKDREVVMTSMEKEIEGFCWEIMDKILPGEAAEWKKEEAKMFEKVLA